MKKVLLLGALFASTFANAGLNTNYRAYSTPVNYNFIELNLSQRTYNFDNDTEFYGTKFDDAEFETTQIALASEFMLEEDIIIAYSLSGEELNDTVSLINLKLGLLKRVGVTDNTDFVFGGGLNLAWASKDVDLDGDGIFESEHDQDIGPFVSMGLRHGFSKRLEGGIEINGSHLSDTKMIEGAVKVTYYPTKKFAVGIAYSSAFSEDLKDSQIGGHIRVRF